MGENSVPPLQNNVGSNYHLRMNHDRDNSASCNKEVLNLNPICNRFGTGIGVNLAQSVKPQKKKKTEGRSQHIPRSSVFDAKKEMSSKDTVYKI